MFNFISNASYLHMETKAKVHLSPKEMELVNNKEWILTRHGITKKVFEMFGELNEAMKKEVEAYAHLFPSEIEYRNGKISKGENYQLLPYVILDYPAFFGKENLFAVRTLFWWGNFFSVTLHVSGRHKENYIQGHQTVLSFLQKNNFFICVNKDEWQHHFQPDNYIPASSITQDDFNKIIKNDFFKISKKISLPEWESVNEFVLTTFREIIELLKFSFPGDKKDL